MHQGSPTPRPVADPDRLRAPLRRRPDGTFEQATAASSARRDRRTVAEIIDPYGPRVVAPYTGTGGYQNSVRSRGARLPPVSGRRRSTRRSRSTSRPNARRGCGWERGRAATRTSATPTSRWRSATTRWCRRTARSSGLQGTNPFVILRRAKARGHEADRHRPATHRAGRSRTSTCRSDPARTRRSSPE